MIAVLRADEQGVGGASTAPRCHASFRKFMRSYGFVTLRRRNSRVIPGAPTGVEDLITTVS